MSTKGGGKKKILWQWKVAVAIFKDHPLYSTAFAMAYNCTDPKLKLKLQMSWAEKIKNILSFDMHLGIYTINSGMHAGCPR